MKRAGRADRSAEIADAAARFAELSPPERETLDALALGHSNKVIAYDLGISPRTVDIHQARLMDRAAVRQFANKNPTFGCVATRDLAAGYRWRAINSRMTHPASDWSGRVTTQ